LERHRPARPLVSTRRLMLVAAAGLLAVTAACGNAATPIPTSTQANTSTAVPTPTKSLTAGTAGLPTIGPTTNLNLGGVVRVGDLDFPVELALKSEDRIKGLSGRASLTDQTGMLFVFEKAERLRFWMREMEISLDIVWISAGCRVVDVSENVPFPHPGTPLNDLPRYSPESPAKYVLEINGGEAAALGVGIGDTVEFLDALEGLYGC